MRRCLQMRRVLTAVLIVAGLGLMVFGYLFSAPWVANAVAGSDPVFLGAPTVFIIGIVLILAAALVYELLPARDDDRVG
jgi:drug/metabolite transporter (DMT)-like permease